MMPCARIAPKRVMTWGRWDFQGQQIHLELQLNLYLDQDIFMLVSNDFLELVTELLAEIIKVPQLKFTRNLRGCCAKKRTPSHALSFQEMSAYKEDPLPQDIRLFCLSDSCHQFFATQSLTRIAPCLQGTEQKTVDKSDLGGLLWRHLTKSEGSDISG